MQVGIFDNLQNGKTVPVSRTMVWESYKEIRNKGRKEGIDVRSLQMYQKNLQDNLYTLWNRMASGSYFPPPVREVAIPKPGGGERKLGVAPLSDKVGQMVVKRVIEERLEGIFHENSYGYRPGKSAHEALKAVRTNCFKQGWVVDVDIKGFFDHIDHELLMLSLEKHIEESWVKMYIRRWLEAPIEQEGGELVYRKGKGTPQGGVLSPILSNLFLHYVLDKWLSVHYKEVKFVRYADDIIIHAKREEEAKEILEAVRERLKTCKLELNESKTRIVYCKSDWQQGTYTSVKFDFLGYTFQPRELRYSNGEIGQGYSAGISQKSRSKIYKELARMGVHKRTERNLYQLAESLNPKLEGWIRYYGLYNRNKLRGVFWHLDARLVKWLLNKYKSLKGSMKRGWELLGDLYRNMPTLFSHWRLGLCTMYPLSKKSRVS